MSKYKSKLIELILGMEAKGIWLDTPYGPFPTKAGVGNGDGGDDCLWNGLLASVKYDKGFSQVVHCQALHDEGRPGMHYRNPLRRSNDNAGHQWYFSRDMAIGVLLAYACYPQPYLFDRANLWLRYIQKNRACAIKKPGWMGGGCWVRSPWYRYAPDDDRSNITPTMWALMGRVWEAKGWARSKQMKRYQGVDGATSVIEAQLAPIGYQLHLKAVQSYLKWMLGQSSEYYEKVFDICYEKQPDNLFYHFLAERINIDPIIKLYIDACPNPETFVPQDYWMWEKSTQEPANSCGWDWVFLGHLLLSRI